MAVTMGGLVVNRKGNDILDNDSNHFNFDFYMDGTSDGVILPKSGLRSEEYVRRLLIWKNEIKGKNEKLGSADAFRYTM